MGLFFDASSSAMGIDLKHKHLKNNNRPPISVSQLSVQMKGKNQEQIAVIVGSVLNDPRLLDVPAMKVCALHFSDVARARITKAGGEAITFDELARRRPTGKNTVLLRGRRNAREAVKHFGAPGVPGSHAKPYVRSKGRKFERARGRRQSRGFKV